MNICLVNNLYPPINTGSSFITSQYAKFLAKKGHNVVVITNAYKELSGLSIEDGVKVYRLPRMKFPKLNLWMSFPDFNFSIFPKNISRIKAILISENVEIIHQCNNIFDLVFASAYFSRKLKLPLICSLMTQMQHTSKLYCFILKLFDITILKYYFSKRVDMYLALDEEARRYINNRYNRKEKIASIPFSINEDFLDNVKGNFKGNLIDYQTTKYTMVSIGHVSHLKDRFETIKAWRIVVEKYPQAKLVVVGDILNRASEKLIEKLNLQKNIVMTGRVPHAEVLNYIKCADMGSVFLSENLPYHRAVGVANLENMAYGLPTILDIENNCFGPNFSIMDGHNCIKIENRNPQLLAEKIIYLFENPELRRKIGLAGKEFVTKTLIWERIIPLIENLYLSEIEKNILK